VALSYTFHIWSLFLGDNLPKPHITVASDPFYTVISAQTRLSSHTACLKASTRRLAMAEESVMSWARL